MFSRSGFVSLHILTSLFICLLHVLIFLYMSFQLHASLIKMTVLFPISSWICLATYTYMLYIWSYMYPLWYICMLYVVEVLDPPRLPLVISPCLVDLWRFFRLKIIVLYAVRYEKFYPLFSSITFYFIY